MDRKHLAKAFDEWMTTGYNSLLESKRYRQGQYLLKSYLVEANTPKPIEGTSDVNRFMDANTGGVPVRAVPTDDPTISSLYVGKSETPFFLDTLDQRFWVLHSTAPATDADKAVRSLILRTRNLDSFWLPTYQMEDWIGQLGLPRILMSKFAVSTGLYQESIPEEQFVDESLVFKIGASGDARERLESYRASPLLASQLALWSATIVRRLGDSDQVTTSTVTASGKLTARGNSFRLHEEVVSGLRQRYASLITGWERQYQLSWNDDEGRITPSGETALIPFPEPLSQIGVEQVISILFNCAEPFRLFGTPVLDESGDRYVVKGLDLHSSHKVDFEITPRLLRVYLGRSSCGNVLARLLTNLQHYVDARARLA